MDKMPTLMEELLLLGLVVMLVLLVIVSIFYLVVVSLMLMAAMDIQVHLLLLDQMVFQMQAMHLMVVLVAVVLRSVVPQARRSRRTSR